MPTLWIPTPLRDLTRDVMLSVAKHLYDYLRDPSPSGSG